MRGKPDQSSDLTKLERIIPAHAGQTGTQDRRSGAGTDHPRACGANMDAPIAAQFRVGSSPRMRGKRDLHSAATRHVRIIPAHAGQTCVARNRPIRLSDHPRACGANHVDATRPRPDSGSSPRMRGKPRSGVRPRRGIRIIPAHAGQTDNRRTSSRDITDHPRACGANENMANGAEILYGSSPRMRGKRLGRKQTVALSRIIPAHAGQTVRFYAKTLERWTLNNWIRTVAPIFVLLFLPPVIGQNAYIERHYSNQSFSWFSKLHYASAFDLSLVA